MTIKKPINIVGEMIAALATPQEIALRRIELDLSAARRFPAHRFSKEEIVATRKTVAVIRTYEYSRWEDWKHRMLCAFAIRTRAEDMQ